jgi:AmiR/NasT family two-component response regulator
VLLRRAVDLGQDVAPDTVGCSVTTIDGDRYRTPVFSDGLALDLDRAQYDSGDGPCMAAARERRSQHFDALTDGERFPGFTEAAIERGVRSSISVPLTGPELPSAINLYATSRHAFDAERPRAVARLLARCVSALMARPELADLAINPPVSASRIEAAQERAKLVADAGAALMTRRPLSRSDALTVLIQRSRAEGRSIFEVARDEIQAGQAGVAS